MKPLHTFLTLTLTACLSSAAAAQPGERGPRHDRDGERDGPPPIREKLGDRDRDRDGRGKPDRPAPQGKSLSVDQLEEAIATLRELHAGQKAPMVDRIVELSKKDPELAARRLSYYPRIREMMAARKERPAEFKLHVRQTTHMRAFLSLVRPFYEAKRKGDEAAMAELRPKIREQVQGMLQVRLEMRRIEIKKLEERIMKMKEEIAKIENNAPALVDEKMQQIEKGKGDGRDKKGPDRRRGGERGEKSERADRGDKPDRD